MSVWNKILLVLVALASLGFFHAAARTVKTYQYWAGEADLFEKKLKERNDEIAVLQTTDHEDVLKDKTKMLGVQQLRIDLARVLANRGHIWTKCEKKKAELDPDPKNPGIMLVTLDTQDSAPNPFTDKMVLYAFEEGDDLSPGRYLGEFRVKLPSDKQIVLASTTQMLRSPNPKVKFLADNVLESRAPWVLYEMMPADEHEALANLPEDQRKWVSQEYLNDGQPMDANGKISQDPKDKKFERPLRDYLAIFRACELYRTLFVDRWESTIRDLSYLEAANQESKIQETLVEKEKAQVDKELGRAETERTAVANLFAYRKNMVDTYQASVQRAIAQNLRYLQIIAKQQKDAAEEVDRRMRSMAQFGPRAN